MHKWGGGEYPCENKICRHFLQGMGASVATCPMLPRSPLHQQNTMNQCSKWINPTRHSRARKHCTRYLELRGVHLYKNNACGLLSRVLRKVNSHWLRSVREEYAWVITYSTYTLRACSSNRSELTILGNMRKYSSCIIFVQLHSEQLVRCFCAGERWVGLIHILNG